MLSWPEKSLCVLKFTFFKKNKVAVGQISSIIANRLQDAFDVVSQNEVTLASKFCQILTNLNEKVKILNWKGSNFELLRFKF